MQYLGMIGKMIEFVYATPLLYIKIFLNNKKYNSSNFYII